MLKSTEERDGQAALSPDEQNPRILLERPLLELIEQSIEAVNEDNLAMILMFSLSALAVAGGTKVALELIESIAENPMPSAISIATVLILLAAYKLTK